MQASKKHRRSSPPIILNNLNGQLGLLPRLNSDLRLRNSTEVSLSNDHNITLACGVMVNKPPEDDNFLCRLLCVDESNDDQVKYVDMQKESFDLLMYHYPTICRLIVEKDKAIIFQHIEVQVFVLEENQVDGFLLHFEDKRRVKISLDLMTFKRLITHKSWVNHEYQKFVLVRNAKRRKNIKLLQQQELAAKAALNENDELRPIGRTLS